MVADNGDRKLCVGLMQRAKCEQGLRKGTREYQSPKGSSRRKQFSSKRLLVKREALSDNENRQRADLQYLVASLPSDDFARPRRRQRP